MPQPIDVRRPKLCHPLVQQPYATARQLQIEAREGSRGVIVSLAWRFTNQLAPRVDHDPANSPRALGAWVILAEHPDRVGEVLLVQKDRLDSVRSMPALRAQALALRRGHGHQAHVLRSS
jgi:hypothetical protein